jgi:glycosyltransferase involved in cell wall biosynthesis
MISIVVPIFNEQELVRLLHAAVADAMNDVGETWEVVYVNDGSRDSSLNLLRELQLEDAHVVVVDLSRNWGHMGAISAGLQTARGDAVVLMDGDFQDPPEVLPELVAAWRGGAQVVTAVRRSRQERRKVLAKLFPLFYRVLGALSDFREFSVCSIDRQSIRLTLCAKATGIFPGCGRGWVTTRRSFSTTGKTGQVERVS